MIPPDQPSIELNAFVRKKANLATGGQAKILIRSGKVMVNGAQETRNKKKLYKGDKVLIDGKAYTVES